MVMKMGIVKYEPKYREAFIQFDSFYMHPAEEANYRRWGGMGELPHF